MFWWLLSRFLSVLDADREGGDPSYEVMKRRHFTSWEKSDDLCMAGVRMDDSSGHFWTMHLSTLCIPLLHGP